MIYETDFQKSIENAFLEYGASVAQERSIADIRDGLKIGLRQGVYSQFFNKLTHKNKFQKAQKSVAAAMSLCYLHGDAAMYDTFIRAAKPFAYRYPIEEAQGAYGTPVASDDHSASRYVEMRSGELADYFFDGLKKNAIDEWYWNYDDTEKIPSVFPSIGFWNIVNGCSGIAVAMSSSSPQFNIREVNAALIKIIKNPDVNFDEIYCAPDFATGGTITNAKEVKESIRNGKGASIRIKAKLEYSPDNNMIKATELPYGVYTNTVISQIKALTEENENYGIERVIDHTKKTSDIRIYLSKGTNVNRMISKLYKDTSLENWFSVNMIFLDMGRVPKLFGWREACDAYITHIRLCKRREIQFDLDKALARENIVDGLMLSAANIDEVVSIIRSSSNPSEASKRLIERFSFNEEQTKAILAMKLSSLTKIDAIKLENEREELLKEIDEFRYLLDTPSALDEQLIKALQEVADKFGDDRRTRVINLVEEEENNSIPEQDCVVFVLSNNNIRIVSADELNGARRGRKGSSIKLPKNVVVSNTLYTTNHGKIGTITKNGKIHFFDIDKLNIGEDYSIYELAALESNDSIVKIINCNDFDYFKYVLFITKDGMIKLTPVSEYNTRASKGVIAIKLREGDCVVDCFLSNNNERIMIASNSGYYNFYSLELNPVGRASIGVKAIGLKENEYVIGATIISNSIEYSGILTINNNGRGKITKLEDFSSTSRGARGYVIQKIEEGESISAIQAIRADSTKISVIAGSKLTSMTVSEIPSQGRNTCGVSLINAKGTDNNIYIIQE